MPGHSIVKPSTAIIVLIGEIGLDNTDKFQLQAMQSRLRFFTPLMDITGDGDAAPVWDNNRLTYGVFSFTGFMLSGQALGLNNLANATPFTFQIVYDGTTKFPKGTGTEAQAVMEQLVIEHTFRAGVVGVAMSGRLTIDDLSTAPFELAT